MRTYLLKAGALPIGALTLVLAMAGCSGTGEDAAPSGPTPIASVPITSQAAPSSDAETEAPTGESTAAAPTTSATPSSSPAEECGEAMSNAALAALADKLPAPNDSTGAQMEWAWDGPHADKDTYDACAALSWVTYPVEGGTGSSPYTIALFHQGKYLGVTTSRTFGFFPEVKRKADGVIVVTYTYARKGESTAGASGRATSTYTWDPQSASVKHAGELPPN